MIPRVPSGVRDRAAAIAVAGALDGWRGLLRRCRERLFSRSRLGRWQIDLEQWRPRMQAGDDVDVRRASREDLAELRRDTTDFRDPAFHADALHGARCCYLGICRGRVAHISWLFTSADRTLLIRLDPREIELNYTYTLPAYRGRGLLGIVQTAMLIDAKRDGIERAFTHVALDNTASAHGVVKVGFRQVGVVTVTWVLGRCFTRYVATDRVTGGV